MVLHCDLESLNRIITQFVSKNGHCLGRILEGSTQEEVSSYFWGSCWSVSFAEKIAHHDESRHNLEARKGRARHIRRAGRMVYNYHYQRPPCA